TGFAPAVRWSGNICFAGETCRVADVNGDGKADAVAFTQAGNPNGGPPGTAWVELSDGKAFGPPVEWSTIICLAGETCQVADVTGDGKADAIAFTQAGTPNGGSPGTAFVELSTGIAFAGPTQWSSSICPARQTCLVGDVDGNGGADAVAFAQGSDGN